LNDRDWLRGAYDTHIHASPDVVPRSVDFLTAARDAHAAGMGAVVFKDIAQPTADRAYAARKLYPGLHAYGGIVLDYPVGGLNPVAVERCLRHGGTFVWMPVSHARHTVRLHQAGKLPALIPPDVSLEESITLLAEDGALRPEVTRILELIVEYDAVLGTGHVSPDEAIALARHARAAGARRIVVNHPSGYAVGATIDQQRELAGLGAYMEHCYAQCTPGLDNIPLSAIAGAIRSVGPAHCILATDLGQTFNPPPAEGLCRFMEGLEQEGIAWDDLLLMTRENPRRLLDGAGERDAAR
jgi:hypothetical protein